MSVSLAVFQQAIEVCKNSGGVSPAALATALRADARFTKGVVAAVRADLKKGGREDYLAALDNPSTPTAPTILGALEEAEASSKKVDPVA